MKHPSRHLIRRTFCAVAFSGILAAAPSTQAATNQAIGDVNGVAADLTDSNVFSLSSTQLALVKAAFLTDGTPLTSPAVVPAGTHVHFMIYVDNTTAVGVNDVNVTDALTGFTYVAGTIKTDNAVATGASAAAIYASAILTAALDDAEDGVDEAGIGGTTISAGSTAGNVQLDIAGSAVWAMVFEAIVQ